MVIHIIMFFTWLHGRIPSQCQIPAVIFEQFAQESWQNCAKIISQDLNLFEEIDDRNGLSHHLAECNLLTISSDEGYIRLKLKPPHKQTSQT